MTIQDVELRVEAVRKAMLSLSLELTDLAHHAEHTVFETCPDTDEHAVIRLIDKITEAKQHTVKAVTAIS